MSLYGFPMVVLMWTDLRLCHPFFKRETKKLRPIKIFCLICSSVCFSFPMATAKHVTFLSWNLTEALVSSTFCLSFSACETTCGNIPILLRTGPKTTGIFLTRESVARRIVYCLAHFLMGFFSLLNFLRESRSTTSISRP